MYDLFSKRYESLLSKMSWSLIRQKVDRATHPCVPFFVALFTWDNSVFIAYVTFARYFVDTIKLSSSNKWTFLFVYLLALKIGLLTENHKYHCRCSIFNDHQYYLHHRCGILFTSQWCRVRLLYCASDINE